MALHKPVGLLKKNPYVVIFFLVIMTALAFPMIRIFALPVVMAAALATLFYPVYKLFNRSFIRSKIVSSLLCCLILLLCVLSPLYFIGFTVSKQVAGFYTSSSPGIIAMVSNGDQGIPKKVTESKFYHWIKANNINLDSIFQDVEKTTMNITSGLINKASTSVALFIGNIFIILFTMFYFFLDGEIILNRLRKLSPLKKTYTEFLFSRFASISRATVKGVLVISLIQATMGGIILLIFGVKNWLMWTLVMAMVGLIPPFGAWLILIPAGIIEIVMGNVWPGVIIIILSFGCVSPMDNLLRPYIVGSSAKMHGLVVFFSTLGGILAFGVMGIIVGPVIAAVFVAAIHMYEMDTEPKKNEQLPHRPFSPIIALKSRIKTIKR